MQTRVFGRLSSRRSFANKELLLPRSTEFNPAKYLVGFLQRQSSSKKAFIKCLSKKSILCFGLHFCGCKDTPLENSQAKRIRVEVVMVISREEQQDCLEEKVKEM